MAKVIKSATVHGAWIDAVGDLLQAPKPIDNLLLEVTDPLRCAPLWLTAHCPRSLGLGVDSIRNVANTIFPERQLSSFSSRADFYSHFAQVYSRGGRARRNRYAWGTYYQRLTDYGDLHLNQLERAVACMCRWQTPSLTAFVFHLSAADRDGPRKRGAPCLQYIELLDHGLNGLGLVAVYRNHDYFGKVLGNLIGLSRLIRFVCDATGRHSGSLVCH